MAARVSTLNFFAAQGGFQSMKIVTVAVGLGESTAKGQSSGGTWPA